MKRQDFVQFGLVEIFLVGFWCVFISFFFLILNFGFDVVKDNFLKFLADLTNKKQFSLSEYVLLISLMAPLYYAIGSIIYYTSENLLASIFDYKEDEYLIRSLESGDLGTKIEKLCFDTKKFLTLSDFMLAGNENIWAIESQKRYNSAILFFSLSRAISYALFLLYPFFEFCFLISKKFLLSDSSNLFDFMKSSFEIMILLFFPGIFLYIGEELFKKKGKLDKKLIFFIWLIFAFYLYSLVQKTLVLQVILTSFGAGMFTLSVFFFSLIMRKIISFKSKISYLIFFLLISLIFPVISLYLSLGNLGNSIFSDKTDYLIHILFLAFIAIIQSFFLESALTARCKANFYLLLAAKTNESKEAEA